MKRKPRWVDKRALLLLHEESLAEFGGRRGMHDEGLLDSALDRAHNKYPYEPSVCTIAGLAAAYGFALSRSHPFIDGNKRIPLLSIGLFLVINGYALRAGQVDAIRTMEDLASGHIGEEQLTAWIAANISPLKRTR